jgi:large conductance mechanosensitive channel
MRALDIEREPDGLSLTGTVFALTTAVLVGKILYRLLFATVDSLIIPFLRGLFGGPEERVLGYVNFSSIPLHADFNGYALSYGPILSVLGTLMLAVVVVVLLIAYARREAQQADVGADVEMRVCPECISLIPATAHRCAYCRHQVQPQAEQGSAST